jgi:metallophosphoesterase (TIGR00282 family)
LYTPYFTVKILFVGDIFGRAGRRAAARLLPQFRESEKADFVVVNAENAAHGAGLGPDHAKELFQAGADVLTLGNHTWDKKEVGPLLEDPRVLRPLNYPPGLPGRGVGVYEVAGRKIAVIQVMGRHNLAMIDCPFRGADAALEGLRADVTIVDAHAEASSEKQALGWHLDGRVTAVIGTHTHVQTADERLLPGGTAYLGDVGMTGPRDGVIGSDRQAAISRFLTGLKPRLEPAEGPVQFCAAVVETDDTTGKALSIKRIFEVLE